MDFVKFYENIKEYLTYPLEECEFNPLMCYPVARLKDIKIYGKHYKDFNELHSKWEERKKIRWDNLFFIMTDRDISFPSKEREVCSRDVIERFDNLIFENKICLVAEEYNKLKSCRIVKKGKEGNCVGIITDIIGFSGKRMYQYAENFDYIKWFNK